VVAVCHHGGAGTTAAGLRAGKPTIIVPFFGDQFFWGSMISKSGVGPAPVPGKTVTAKQLAAAFEFVHDPKVQSAALQISTKFQNEHGCEVAVRSFHAYLPLHKMRSDLEPSFAACFRLNEYGLQISRPVAQVLVAAGAIEEFELSPHPIHGWPTLMHGDRLKTFTHGFRRAASKISDSVNRLKRPRSLSNTDRRASRARQNNIRHEIMNISRPFKDSLRLYGEVKEKPKDEHNENSTLEKKVKHSVHYGLVTLVEKLPINNDRNSTTTAGSSHDINSSRKNIAKSRPNNNTNSPSQSKNDGQINKNPNQRSILLKDKSSSQSKEKNNNKSPEQKAADISGLSIDVCKQILSDFKQIKHDRYPSIDNDKSAHRPRIPIGLHRQRSRSTTTQ
jgi:hypothetical protein